MSDEYLWDRSGFPEPDELELERLLAPLGLRAAPRAPAQRAVVRRLPTQRFVAGVLAIAACVCLGWWLGGRSPAELTIMAEPQGEPASAGRSVSAASDDMAHAPAPAGSEELASGVVDPWGSEARAARRPHARPRSSPQSAGEPEIIDPWGTAASATAPRPPSKRIPKDEVIDPWRSDPGKGASKLEQGLSPSAVRRFVSDNRSRLVTACWEPAKQRAAADAPQSARVVVKLTIAPSGRVERATSSSDPVGYPGLAPCLRTEMRDWVFPQSEGRTDVSIPLVFVRD